jgi:hypothetical protein
VPAAGLLVMVFAGVLAPARRQLPKASTAAGRSAS